MENRTEQEPGSSPGVPSPGQSAPSAKAWRERSLKLRTVTLPSGFEVVLRRMTIFDLCALGHIPFTDLDEVMKMGKILAKSPEAVEGELSMEKVREEDIGKMANLFRKATLLCVYEPKVVDHETDKDTEMYVKDVPFADQMFIFTEAMKPDEVLSDKSPSSETGDS